MPPLSARASATWIGGASTSIVPPPDYWAHLACRPVGPQLERLRHLSDERLNEFFPSALGPPLTSAVELLDRVAADGWLERHKRQSCPNCSFQLDEQEATGPLCPDCHEPFDEHGGPVAETVYVRNLAPSRDVAWVVAIHGMNTTGAWQEAFSWYLGTTWGRSVPVAVYKYGIIIAGVVMAWRRGKLQNDLRDKLAALRDEARAEGFPGNPDVIAHSFGTWLLGHLLKNELTRESEQQLRFGRIILTGCVLRPDFDWRRIRDAGLVEDVLNHYGSKDQVVPLAHFTIRDSGPSGRRGFDGDQILNLRAEGYGHSDLFSVDRCVANGKSFQPRTGAAGEMTHLEYSYKRYWRPFLTLPRQELPGLPDRADPSGAWRQLSWPLRGTLFPLVGLPFIVALLAYAWAGIGKGLWEMRQALAIIAGASGAGLGLILAGIALTALWRQVRGRADRAAP